MSLLNYYYVVSSYESRTLHAYTVTYGELPYSFRRKKFKDIKEDV